MQVFGVFFLLLPLSSALPYIPQNLPSCKRNSQMNQMCYFIIQHLWTDHWCKEHLIWKMMCLSMATESVCEELKLVMRRYSLAMKGTKTRLRPRGVSKRSDIGRLELWHSRALLKQDVPCGSAFLVLLVIQSRRRGKSWARQWILQNSTPEHLFIYREKKLHFQTNLLQASAVA